ncbi:MAG TPA: UDP-N-acetylmuramate dehydrogenase [Candidatus Dojkabacteria bacterium]|mgnify:CR=1 FL=1|nr:UDP-N-acetylmuramate dehydrogenase [Candidatus Dojkabacteria bacterium]
MQILQDYNLSEISHYRIGGKARYYIEIENENDLLFLPQIINEKKCKYMVIGDTTNILFDDKGYDGMIIKISCKKIEYDDKQADDTTVMAEVDAGVSMNYLALEAANKGLSGLEWAGGLPGTLGGAIRGNAGCFKGETKDNIIEVKSFDIEKGVFVTRNSRECEFGYRTSIFKTESINEIIWSAKISLTRSDTNGVIELTQQRVQYRLNNHPMEYPSLGSTFKNVPVNEFRQEVLEENGLVELIKDDPFPIIPTGILIDRSGLKGYKVGGAEISIKHANFLVNTGGATSEDVEAVIKHVKDAVKEKFGVGLQVEIMIVK